MLCVVPPVLLAPELGRRNPLTSGISSALPWYPPSPSSSLYPPSVPGPRRTVRRRGDTAWPLHKVRGNACFRRSYQHCSTSVVLKSYNSHVNPVRSWLWCGFCSGVSAPGLLGLHRPPVGNVSVALPAGVQRPKLRYINAGHHVPMRRRARAHILCFVAPVSSRLIGWTSSLDAFIFARCKSKSRKEASLDCRRVRLAETLSSLNSYDRPNECPRGRRSEVHVVGPNAVALTDLSRR